MPSPIDVGKDLFNKVPRNLQGPLKSIGTGAVLDLVPGIGNYNVNSFRAILGLGVTHTNHFRMLFTPPNVLTENAGLAAKVLGGLAGRDLTMMCFSSSIPGKQVTSIDYRDSGPIRKIPNGYLVDELSLQFYVHESMPERALFETWIDFITGTGPQHSLRTRNDTTAISAQVYREQGLEVEDSGIGKYDIEFYDNLVSNLVLEKYSVQGHREYIYTFEEAYPVSVTEVPVSWEADNEIVRIGVNFAFRDWQGVPVPTPAAVKSALDSSLGSLKKLPGSLQKRARAAATSAIKKTLKKTVKNSLFK